MGKKAGKGQAKAARQAQEAAHAGPYGTATPGCGAAMTHHPTLLLCMRRESLSVFKWLLSAHCAPAVMHGIVDPCRRGRAAARGGRGRRRDPRPRGRHPGKPMGSPLPHHCGVYVSGRSQLSAHELDRHDNWAHVWGWGQLRAACGQFEAALAVKPADLDTHYNFGAPMRVPCRHYASPHSVLHTASI